MYSQVAPESWAFYLDIVVDSRCSLSPRDPAGGGSHRAAAAQVLLLLPPSPSSGEWHGGPPARHDPAALLWYPSTRPFPSTPTLFHPAQVTGAEHPGPLLSGACTDGDLPHLFYSSIVPYPLPVFYLCSLSSSRAEDLAPLTRCIMGNLEGRNWLNLSRPTTVCWFVMWCEASPAFC
jgi:hypothetical protein